MGRRGAWLAALCLVWLVVGWTAPAMGAHTSGYATGVKRLNRQEIQERAANGADQVVAIDGGTSAGLIKSGGIKSWLADHGMGLVKGIGAGLIGAAVVAGGAALIFGAAAPLLLMAGSAVVGGALYGALTGSAHFSWAEAIAGSLIGGASAGMGSWIAGMGSRFATRIGVAAVEMVGGGVINTIGYLIHETHRTLGGALAAFGVGAGAAALFMGAGAVVGRVWRWGKRLLLPQGLTEEQFQMVGAKVREAAAQKGYGSNIGVHGSRARGTARPDSDLDIAIRVSADEFDRFIKQAFKTPNPGSSKERTMLYSIKHGIIQRGEIKMSSVGEALKKELGLSDVQISVIKMGGPFDQGPYIDLP